MNKSLVLIAVIAAAALAACGKKEEAPAPAPVAAPVAEAAAVAASAVAPAMKLLPPLLMPLPMLPRQLLTPLQKRPRLLPPSNRIYRLPEKATFEWLFFWCAGAVIIRFFRTNKIEDDIHVDSSGHRICAGVRRHRT